MDKAEIADILNLMLSRGMSIFVCLMTMLCPVLCTAELAAHRAEHSQSAPEHAIASHAHDDDDDHDHSHHGHGHGHGPDGEPIPHDDHSCLCTGSTAPGPALQIPALAPAGIIAAQDLVLAGLILRGDTVEHTAFRQPDYGTRIAPLLI